MSKQRLKFLNVVPGQLYFFFLRSFFLHNMGQSCCGENTSRESSRHTGHEFLENNGENSTRTITPPKNRHETHHSPPEMENHLVQPTRVNDTDFTSVILPYLDTTQIQRDELTLNDAAVEAKQFESFFSSLHIPLDSLQPYYFMYRMNAVSKPWCLTVKEFTAGMRDWPAVRSSSDIAPQVKKELDDLFSEKREAPMNHKRNRMSRDNFFRFVFHFSRNSSSASVVFFDEAADVWLMCLKAASQTVASEKRFPPEKLIDYLKKRGSKPISKDLWMEAFRFCATVGPNPNAQQAIDACFPVLLEELAEEEEKNR